MILPACYRPKGSSMLWRIQYFATTTPPSSGLVCRRGEASLAALDRVTLASSLSLRSPRHARGCTADTSKTP
jgi:hypothetical protein